MKRLFNLFGSENLINIRQQYRTMLFTDPVYGTFDITEPVLLELINSKPMQRLQGISQYGLPPQMYHHHGFSRYDHCLGVMLLLRKLDASLKEQIAGLLHDVSHTAFSHVVDWVFGSQLQEDFQDSNHEKYIRNSEIPATLQKYGFNVNEIIDMQRYSLLEQPSPSLCADRVDYALREFHDWANPAIVPLCVESLRSYEGRIIFISQQAASEFALHFLKCQTEHWGDAETVVRYHLLAKALRIGLDEKILTKDDLFQDDTFVLSKLEQSAHPKIIPILTALKCGITYTVTDKNPDIVTQKKFRHVDPEFMKEGKVFVLSLIDKTYAALIAKHQEINQKGISIKLSAPF